MGPCGRAELRDPDRILRRGERLRKVWTARSRRCQTRRTGWPSWTQPEMIFSFIIEGSSLEIW